jgi:hypothetical protein
LEDVGSGRGGGEGQLESVVETIIDSEKCTHGHVLRQVEDSGRSWMLIGWKAICLTEIMVVSQGVGDNV